MRFVFLLCLYYFHCASCGWWENGIIYQIYPRSFKDSNNDGLGDLRGIESRLDHIVESKVTAIWLSPIYKSPMVDMGYDISDYKEIHPDFGTMEDFQRLVQKCEDLGIEVIMDFVPNHTSDQHEWFEKSAAREPGYENFYVWLDGRDNNTKPPNNWISAFQGSAWTFHEGRKQWYLHQFAPQQPDLNYREPLVLEAMDDVLRFWLEKGVRGFRMDAVQKLVEAKGFPDEPESHDPSATPDDPEYLLHIYTNDQPETYAIIYHWRSLIDNRCQNSCIMIVEAFSHIQELMLYYGNETSPGAHFAFNFQLIFELNADSTARDVAFEIKKWMVYMPEGRTANWVLGNHDQHRVASRFGPGKVDGFVMLQMVLPGVAVVYNGDEFAQEDGEVNYEQGKDPQGCNAGKDRYHLYTRDPERTPLQWNTSVNAGFNDGAPTWLPVSEKYLETNLNSQVVAEKSHFKVYQKAVDLKKYSPTIEQGELEVKPLGTNVLTLIREFKDEPSIVYVFNMNNEKQEVVNLTKAYPRIPSKLKIIISSTNSKYEENTSLNSSNVVLQGNESIVFST